jgi:methionyl-tRNA formyltransferase
VHDGTILKIYRSEKSEVRSQKSAGIDISEGKLYVGTGSGTISVLEIQQEGKKRMSAEEFLRGYKFNNGDVLK